MSQLKCIIIEDEPLAMERTVKFLMKVPFLDLVGSYDNALGGLEHLRREELDILFLDINMDELTGIELLESTAVQAEIIITTAYPEYALKGYDLNVTDYLLKPFTFQRFLQAVNKAQENLKKTKSHAEYIFIKTENKYVKVNYKDVLYIEGMRDYRRIFLRDGSSVMTLQKFSDLALLIPVHLICRVHKSYMISISKLEAVERNSVRIGRKVIPISATYKEEFFSHILS